MILYNQTGFRSKSLNSVRGLSWAIVRNRVPLKDNWTIDLNGTFNFRSLNFCLKLLLSITKFSKLALFQLNTCFFVCLFLFLCLFVCLFFFLRPYNTIFVQTTLFASHNRKWIVLDNTRGFHHPFLITITIFIYFWSF